MLFSPKEKGYKAISDGYHKGVTGGSPVVDHVVRGLEGFQFDG